MTVELDPFGLAGRRVAVVGGSSGIGLGIGRRLADLGADVAITGTRSDAAAYEDDLSGLRYHRLDATDDDAVRALAETVGDVDVLVYSGGTVAYGRAEYELDNFRRVLDVNLTGAMSCATAFHDGLVANRGSVLLVGSVASFRATPGQPAYSASKGALRTLVMSLAHAWAKDGVRVNGLAPGLVATKLTAISPENPAVYEASLRKIPLGRWGTTEEMGNVAAFLVSPLSSYVTGQMVLVDGGLTLS